MAAAREQEAPEQDCQQQQPGERANGLLHTGGVIKGGSVLLADELACAVTGTAAAARGTPQQGWLPEEALRAWLPTHSAHRRRKEGVPWPTEN